MHRNSLGHNISYFLKSDMNELLISHSLKSFSMALISIFLPIFLLEFGYSFREVMIYELVALGLCVFLNFLSIYVAARYGLKKSFIFSYLFVIVFYFFLLNFTGLVENYGKIVSIVFIGIISMVNTSFYFMSFHLDFRG